MCYKLIFKETKIMNLFLPFKNEPKINSKRLLIASILFLLITSTSQSQTLRDIAPNGKYIGTIVNGNFFNNQGNNGPNYEGVIAEQFSSIVAENDHKFENIMNNEPSDIYDINTYNINTNKLDRLIDFANVNNIDVKRGHALMWYNQAGWLNGAAADWSREKIYTFATNYITKVISYRAGEINEWDVFNEIISDNNDGFRTGTWYDNVVADGKTVQDFLDHCFVVSRNALTAALGETEGNKVKLYYNDYSIESYDTNPNSKNGFMRNMISEMVNRGVPIDALGLQSHFVSPVDESFTNSISQTMDEMIGLGLICNITELDIRICNGAAPASAAELEEQRDSYERVAAMAIAKEGCTGITLWGFTDAHSWIPGWSNGECGDALIYDNDYNEKPAYYGLASGLSVPCLNNPTVPQAPFSGTPAVIPGVIEFEDYDLGGEGVSYSDIDLSNNGESDYRDECDAVDVVTEGSETIIGWLSVSEWLEYTVNITQLGNYSFIISTAADVGFEGEGSIEVDGVDVSGLITFPSTGGWSNYQDTEVINIALNAGEHVLRFNVESGSFNIDKMTISSSTLEIDNFDLNANLKAYPIPFNSTLNISYNDIERTESLNLLDINGRKVLNQKYNNEAVIKMSAENISSGMYFLQLNLRGSITKIIKVIKK